ncbi:MAG: ParD-like family protein [Synergistaceae bacterium]|jgi:hypothetical protein|nr:ParD-like family protein [Synergistaceae bacterium]
MNNKVVKLSSEMLEEAGKYAAVFSRSVPRQIEHWAKIGKIAEENPDLPYDIIKDILLGVEDMKVGNVSEYKFG